MVFGPWSFDLWSLVVDLLAFGSWSWSLVVGLFVFCRLVVWSLVVGLWSFGRSAFGRLVFGRLVVGRFVVGLLVVGIGPCSLVVCVRSFVGGRLAVGLWSVFLSSFVVGLSVFGVWFDGLWSLLCRSLVFGRLAFGIWPLVFGLLSCGL